MDSECITEVKESLARTVVSIVSALVNVRMRVAVEDGDSHVVQNPSANIGCIGVKSVVSESAGWFEQAIIASGNVGLDGTQESTFDQGIHLTAIKTRIFFTAPVGKILNESY